MEIETQQRVVDGVYEAARLLHAVRGLESELQRILAAAMREAAAGGVPQAVLVEAADVSKGWVSRLLQEQPRPGEEWSDTLDGLMEDPRQELKSQGSSFGGKPVEAPFAARRPSAGPVLPAINPLLSDSTDPAAGRVADRVADRLAGGLVPTLSLPHDQAHGLLRGEASDALVPWSTWYRGKIAVHARGAGSGERGQIIGTITLSEVRRSTSARPAEAYEWLFDQPEPAKRQRTARRGAGGFYWGTAPE